MRNSGVPDIRVRDGDEWGQHHVAAIRRIAQIGHAAWALEEYENPSWKNAEWITFVDDQYEKVGRPTHADLAGRF